MSDNRDCIKNYPFFLSGKKAEVEIISKQGEKWLLKTRINNQASFFLALWITRLLAILGPLLGYFCLVRYKKILELKEREKNQHLKQLTDLAAKVAHDVRSPVAALTILEKTESQISDEGREMLSSCLNRIKSIASDLLNEYKSKAHEEFNLKDELSHLIKQKKLEFTQDQIDLSLCTEDLPNHVIINIDLDKFQRCLSNVINNAKEASEEASNKAVIVSAFLPDPNKTCVSVKDYGKGIPKSILSKLGTTRITHGKKQRSGSGTGLGLFQTQQFINESGGELIIESAENNFTEVKILLPTS
jgi:signal transduction histidine kinase